MVINMVKVAFHGFPSMVIVISFPEPKSTFGLSSFLQEERISKNTTDKVLVNFNIEFIICCFRGCVKSQTLPSLGAYKKLKKALDLLLITCVKKHCLTKDRFVPPEDEMA
jgi:hypothetical protein